MHDKYPLLSLDGFETEEQKQERYHKAKAEAYQAAEMLKTEFGVREVILFGSLLDVSAFGAHSDIDLAVRGMSMEAFYRANGRLLDVIRDFDFHLVDMDACKPIVLENILRTGEAI